MVVRKSVCKRRPSAAKSLSRSQEKEKGISCPNLLDTFLALRCDIERARELNPVCYGSDSEDEEEYGDDGGYDFHVFGGGNQNGRKLASVLNHITKQLSKLEEEICTFGQMRSKWQTHKDSRTKAFRRTSRGKPGSQRQSLFTTVSSFCQSPSGGSVEFSRLQVQIPHPSLDALKMHVCKRLKLKHPNQVQVEGIQHKRDQLEHDELPPKPKVTQSVAKSGRSMVQIHYPVRFSVCPSSVQLLVLDVVAFQVWKRDDSASACYNDSEECVTSNLSALLEDVARRNAEGHETRKATRMLGFSIERQIDKTCPDLADSLLEEEHGFYWPVLQVRDHSKSKAILFEAQCEEMAVATLQRGGSLHSLQKAAKKQTIEVTLTEAFSGNHVLDLTALSSDRVVDIKDRVARKLDAPVQMKFINGRGMVLNNRVKASKINSYKTPMRPAPDDATPQRVVKLEVRKSATTHQTSPASQSEAKAKGSENVKVARSHAASARRVASAKSPECYGLVFIDTPNENDDQAIVLTKTVKDAERLAEALAQARPEIFLRVDYIERFQMQTVAEMLAEWSPEKHLVKKSRSR